MDAELSWQEWKRWLSRAVQTARASGVGGSDLVSSAERIGDFLARYVDPANPQQRALKELWTVASEDEQRAIASALIKLVAGEEAGRGETAGRTFTLE